MSTLVASGLPCDECGSSDAVSEYLDGSSYCFSCQYYFHPTWSSVVEFKRPAWKNPNKIEMPNSIPVQPDSMVYAFLKQRHFTDEQIFFYNIRQSLDGKSLVLCSWGKLKQHSYYEIRNIDISRNAPKYITIGNKKVGYNGKIDSKAYVILVEDMMSAMRVGWNYNCAALRGTKLSEENLAWLCTKKQPYHIITWFDNDIPGQEGAKDIQQKLSWCGFKYTNVITRKDPKMYTDEEIKQILTEKVK